MEARRRAPPRAGGGAAASARRPAPQIRSAGAAGLAAAAAPALRVSHPGTTGTKRPSPRWWARKRCGWTSAADARCFRPTRRRRGCWRDGAGCSPASIPATTSTTTACCTTVRNARSRAFRTERTYDLITLRMVAEHIAHPRDAVAALARLAKPGGRVVVYTVWKWSPASIAAAVTPMAVHHRLKKLLWDTASGQLPDHLPHEHAGTLRACSKPPASSRNPCTTSTTPARWRAGRCWRWPSCRFGSSCAPPACPIRSVACSASTAGRPRRARPGGRAGSAVSRCGRGGARCRCGRASDRTTARRPASARGSHPRLPVRASGRECETWPTQR